MSLDSEVQSWIEEMRSAGVSEAVIGALTNEAEKTPGISNALKGSVSATKDYKRKMDLVAKQEADAQKLAAANAALQQELVRWKTADVDPVLSKANQIVADQAALRARIGERAKQLREKYAMDDADIADLLDTSALVKEAAEKAAESKGATVTDEGKFVRSEEFNRVTMSMPRVAARISKLGRQFDRLFAGTEKEFDPDAVLELAERESLKLDEAFSKLYDVPARQAQLTEVAVQKRIDEELARQKAAWEAKHATNPSYVSPEAEPSLISKVLERHNKEKGANGDGKIPEGSSQIDRIRKAARGNAPEEDVRRYVAISRSPKMKELIQNYEKQAGTWEQG